MYRTSHLPPGAQGGLRASMRTEACPRRRSCGSRATLRGFTPRWVSARERCSSRSSRACFSPSTLTTRGAPASRGVGEGDRGAPREAQVDRQDPGPLPAGSEPEAGRGRPFQRVQPAERCAERLRRGLELCIPEARAVAPDARRRFDPVYMRRFSPGGGLPHVCLPHLHLRHRSVHDRASRLPSETDRDTPSSSLAAQ